MKFMIASDLHGSLYACKKMLDCYKQEKAKRLILLGDLLYHGPRNPLPTEYDPKAVAELLNQKKEEILCVRGNCDAEVDQMVLEFPICAQYMPIFVDGFTICATHGHLYQVAEMESELLLQENDVILYGHTHQYVLQKKGKYLYANPGSVSMPKAGNEPTYMIYENGQFQIKNFEQKELLTYER